MAKTHEVKAEWHEIDPATLPTSLRTAYDAYKAQYRSTVNAREAFEAAMNAVAKLPVTERLVFGYRFGKLSVANVPAEQVAAPKASRSALSLSAFLSAQR